MMDNYDLWERHDRRQEELLARRPVCSCCERHIQDNEGLHYGDVWLCLECIDDNMELIDE